MSTVNNDIPFVPENTTDPAAGLNQALNVIDALLQVAVLGIQNAPPGSPAEGDRYIVSPTGTADWAGHDNQLARWQDGAWQFYDARIAVNLGDSRIYSFDGTAWTDPAGGGVTALQPGDNVSELVNDAGYVETVNGETGPTVTLDADDIDDTSTTNKFATQAQLDAADGALQAVNNLLDVADAPTARTNLGLGTAATANVTTSDADTTSGRVWRTNDLVKTTSATDTTAGRMIKVGDFGFGEAILLTSPDLDTILDFGTYYASSGTNTPPGSGNGYFTVMRGSGSLRNQVYYGSLENRIWRRYRQSGTWSAWVEIYHTGNLGAGTPSKGDILVHNGTNYVRLPVGTNGQVLTANDATASGVEWV